LSNGPTLERFTASERAEYRTVSILPEKMMEAASLHLELGGVAASSVF